MKRKFIQLVFIALIQITYCTSNIDNCSAQWVQTNCPFGENINSLAFSGTELFAGTWGSGVLLSNNNGENWTEVNNGLTNHTVLSLVVSGMNLFAGTFRGGVFLSTNSGENWKAVNDGLGSLDVFAFAVSSGPNIFAGTYKNNYHSGGETSGGIFLSTNNGTKWISVNNELTNQTFRTLVVIGTNLFAGTDGGVYLSTNNGTNWTAVNKGLTTNQTV